MIYPTISFFSKVIYVLSSSSKIPMIYKLHQYIHWTSMVKKMKERSVYFGKPLLQFDVLREEVQTRSMIMYLKYGNKNYSSTLMFQKGKQHFNLSQKEFSKYSIYIHPSRYCSTSVEEKNMHLWPRQVNDHVTGISKHKLLNARPQVLGME